jgi:zinc transport system substrate-binding protein
MLKISKKLVVFLVSISVIFSSGCSIREKSNNKNIEKKLSVAVSIVPQEAFVKEVGGDKVDVITMIPPGKSPENFAPTPDIMEKLSGASIYFSIGVPTEEASILPKIRDFNKNIEIVNMADEVSKVYAERVKVMINDIEKQLSTKDPTNKSFYKTNAENYLNKLDKLDADLKSSLLPLKNKAFICYHPAFGYLADDYGLKMVSLEQEGKEATTEDFQKTIDFAKKEGIKTIFYQAEIDSKQSKTFASEIGGKTEMVDPLSSDYINNLEKIAETFKKVMEVN